MVRLENTQLIPLAGTNEFEVYGVFGLHQLEDDSLLIITQELGLYKWKEGGMCHLPERKEEPLSDMNIIG